MLKIASVLISTAYPTFGSNTPVVVDGDYHYTNMFDVVVDSFYSALEKLNYGGANVYVAETGWPTRGNPPYTSVENARTYNQGLLKKFTMGSTRATLRRPNVPVVTFFFEMTLFTPNMIPVYDMWNISVSSWVL
ncbi:hypothetical protein BRARA_G02129 [Brassica rapa]|uniref:glucan endo-1,3-beta-D-glucosidase n=1 Tax=Brassica campestris TaxID=3711 RepID=A0A397YN60_BRACM|nr:hypothetical protein BRARA_G02129 [Brassica rapa]